MTDTPRAQFSLPGLPEWSVRKVESDRPDRHLNSQFLTCEENHSGIAVCKHGAAEFLVKFSMGPSFLVRMDERVVDVFDDDSSPEETTHRHLLDDQISPRILAQNGELVLHAGAVTLAGKAILFLGPSGAGKSSLVAHFTKQTGALLGDDAIIMASNGETPVAKSVYPSLRLNLDAIEKILPTLAALEPISHYSEKRRVNLLSERFSVSQEDQVRAIFFVGPDRTDEDVRLRRMSKSEVCMSLIENSFWLDPTDKNIAAIKLQQASKIANSCAGYYLTYPRNFGILPDVERTIKAEIGLD